MCSNQTDSKEWQPKPVIQLAEFLKAVETFHNRKRQLPHYGLPPKQAVFFMLTWQDGIYDYYRKQWLRETIDTPHATAVGKCWLRLKPWPVTSKRCFDRDTVFKPINLLPCFHQGWKVFHRRIRGDNWLYYRYLNPDYRLKLYDYGGDEVLMWPKFKPWPSASKNNFDCGSVFKPVIPLWLGAVNDPDWWARLLKMGLTVRLEDAIMAYMYKEGYFEPVRFNVMPWWGDEGPKELESKDAPKYLERTYITYIQARRLLQSLFPADMETAQVSDVEIFLWLRDGLINVWNCQYRNARRFKDKGMEVATWPYMEHFKPDPSSPPNILDMLHSLYFSAEELKAFSRSEPERYRSYEWVKAYAASLGVSESDLKSILVVKCIEIGIFFWWDDPIGASYDDEEKTKDNAWRRQKLPVILYRESHIKEIPEFCALQNSQKHEESPKTLSNQDRLAQFMSNGMDKERVESFLNHSDSAEVITGIDAKYRAKVNEFIQTLKQEADKFGGNGGELRVIVAGELCDFLEENSEGYFDILGKAQWETFAFHNKMKMRSKESAKSGKEKQCGIYRLIAGEWKRFMEPFTYESPSDTLVQATGGAEAGNRQREGGDTDNRKYSKRSSLIEQLSPLVTNTDQLKNLLHNASNKPELKACKQSSGSGRGWNRECVMHYLANHTRLLTKDATQRYSKSSFDGLLVENETKKKS